VNREPIVAQAVALLGLSIDGGTCENVNEVAGVPFARDRGADGTRRHASGRSLVKGDSA
jgi:hypothetical protein